MKNKFLTSVILGVLCFSVNLSAHVELALNVSNNTQLLTKQDVSAKTFKLKDAVAPYGVCKGFPFCKIEKLMLDKQKKIMMTSGH